MAFSPAIITVLSNYYCDIVVSLNDYKSILKAFSFTFQPLLRATYAIATNIAAYGIRRATVNSLSQIFSDDARATYFSNKSETDASRKRYQHSPPKQLSSIKVS